jgi:protease-4
MTEDTSNQPPPPPLPPQQRPAPYPPQYSYPPQYAAPYAIPPRPRRSAWFYISIITASIVVFGIMLWAVGRSVSKSMNGDITVTGSGSDQIGVIDVSGVIVDADKLDSQIRKMADNDSVKAIILHINSPGGGAAASQEVYNEVLRIRQEKHKKIVASIESVGASGAYYIASACDGIYANDASVVGSIGVIMEWTNYGELYRWAKLKSVVIHAGELKDAGDPTHDVTPEEQAYFQGLVDNMYGQFIHDVATGRHTTDEKIKPLATGQVWTGQQSLPLGLIDHVGGFRSALMDTAKSVGISGEPSIARPASQKKGLIAMLTSDGEDIFPNPSQLLNHSPGFYFLWK